MGQPSWVEGLPAQLAHSWLAKRAPEREASIQATGAERSTKGWVEFFWGAIGRPAPAVGCPALMDRLAGPRELEHRNWSQTLNPKPTEPPIATRKLSCRGRFNHHTKPSYWPAPWLLSRDRRKR